MYLLNNHSGLVLPLLYFVLICGLYAEPLVKISQVLVQGIILKSRNGRDISSFIGIPYGQAPIGKLRQHDEDSTEPSDEDFTKLSDEDFIDVSSEHESGLHKRFRRDYIYTQG